MFISTQRIKGSSRLLAAKVRAAHIKLVSGTNITPAEKPHDLVSSVLKHPLMVVKRSGIITNITDSDKRPLFLGMITNISIKEVAGSGLKAETKDTLKAMG